MGFADELNEVGKEQSQVVYEKQNSDYKESLSNAQCDYEKIKQLLLLTAKNSGYIKYNDKKYIECLFKPTGIYGHSHTTLDWDLKKGLFGNVKIVYTNCSDVLHTHPDVWNIYFDEIKRLGKIDNVKISAVTYDTSHNRIFSNSFPTKINTKLNVGVTPSLRLHCSILY